MCSIKKIFLEMKFEKWNVLFQISLDGSFIFWVVIIELGKTSSEPVIKIITVFIKLSEVVLKNTNNENWEAGGVL